MNAKHRPDTPGQNNDNWNLWDVVLVQLQPLSKSLSGPKAQVPKSPNQRIQSQHLSSEPINSIHFGRLLKRLRFELHVLRLCKHRLIHGGIWLPPSSLLRSSEAVWLLCEITVRARIITVTSPHTKAGASKQQAQHGY
eukprot:2876681-Amphidinium_carterae.1